MPGKSINQQQFNFINPPPTNQFIEQPQPSFTQQNQTPNYQAPINPNSEGVLELLEKLGKLHEGGVLTEAEFNAKKTELLNRL